ncbi:MAG: toll/interleukin-1 receptor domain-containing protein [Aggregatilineales bacterium]
MDSPFEQPAPTDPIQRIHDFARDLAYGAVIGEWSASIGLRGGRNPSDDWFKDHTAGYETLDSPRAVFYRKWQIEASNEVPPFSRVNTFAMLISFGYLTHEREQPFTMHDYLLTGKAFALLEKPVAPLDVFVSYRRMQSSALALLVEARLKIADSDMDAFVDKDIPVGNEWENELREKVRSADYFISLIGTETLVSPNVMDEIQWALDANCRIVTILHPGFRFEHITNPDARQQKIIAELNKRQLIMIDSESAEHYDSAIRKLLNTLGYSTL